MANPSACVKLVIDTSKYSSFVPVIGVYVAGASIVCFLAIFFDIFYGVRGKKTWIPCKFFALNSLTLTLLAVAAKFPVDLTTPMPSALDQVSKLSGNSLVCISTGFFMPSLGQKQKHDCLTNMLALSIFVITLIVNTCIQIHTGVVFLFIPQHIITMCCMLAMLCPLWINFVLVARNQPTSNVDCKNLIRTGSHYLLHRLKDAYFSCIRYKPDEMVYALSRTLENCSVVGLCIISVVALLHPAVKNFSLEFCGGSSDYGKSVWIIVLVQILTVLAGTFATIIRAFGLSNRLQISSRLVVGIIHGLPMPDDKKSPKKWFGFLLTSVLLHVSFLLHVLVCIPVAIVFKGFGQFGLLRRRGDRDHAQDIWEWLKVCELQEIDNPAVNWGGLCLEMVMNMPSQLKLDFPFDTKVLSELFTVNRLSQYDVDVSDLATEIEVSVPSVRMLIQIARLILPGEFYSDLVKAYHGAEVIFTMMRLQKIYPPIIYISQEDVLPRRCLDECFLAMGEEYFLVRESRVPIPLLREKLQQMSLGKPLSVLNYIDSKYGFRRESDTDKSFLQALIRKMFCVMVNMIIRDVPKVIYKSLMNMENREDLRLQIEVSLSILNEISSMETCFGLVFPEYSGITGLRLGPSDPYLPILHPRVTRDLNIRSIFAIMFRHEFLNTRSHCEYLDIALSR